MILKCTCGNHASKGATFQNNTHGLGRRVFNQKKNYGARCSVCLAEKTPEEVAEETRGHH